MKEQLKLKNKDTMSYVDTELGFFKYKIDSDKQYEYTPTRDKTQYLSVKFNDDYSLKVGDSFAGMTLVKISKDPILFYFMSNYEDER